MFRARRQSDRSRGGGLLAARRYPGPNIASATLGEDSSTVEKDVTRLRAQRSVTPSTAYSVHELQLREAHRRVNT